MKQLKPIQVAMISMSILLSTLVSAAAPLTPTLSLHNETPEQSDIFIANAPAYYPPVFQNLGIMRGSPEGASRILEISGHQYAYGTNTKVHSISSQFASIQNITIGTLLGFNVVKNNTDISYLSEIWIIPNSALQNKNLDL